MNKSILLLVVALLGCAFAMKGDLYNNMDHPALSDEIVNHVNSL